MRIRPKLHPLPVVFLVVVFLAACDTGTTATPAPASTTIPTQAAQPGNTVQAGASPTTAVQAPADTATALYTPTEQALAAVTGTPVDQAAVPAPPTADENAPSPTPVTATSTGTEMTALQALASLKQKALAWQSDARLALLANTRPGQQKNLLGGTLGSADVNEATPGGKGRNWTLVAFSPSVKGAMAFSMDGSQEDLVKEGAVSTDMVSQFTGSGSEALALSPLDLSKLQDSDKIAAKAGQRGQSADAGIVLLSPVGLGLGPLPNPQPGGQPPQIAYELFNQTSDQQIFMFFDAVTGAVLLDSSVP